MSLLTLNETSVIKVQQKQVQVQIAFKSGLKNKTTMCVCLARQSALTSMTIQMSAFSTQTQHINQLGRRARNRKLKLTNKQLKENGEENNKQTKTLV